MTRDYILIVFSYLLGCFNTGYYFAKRFYHQDIRETGTGVTGAMNVSRIAGRKGFIFTFLGDALKGVLTVFLCRIFYTQDWVVLSCILMVLLGHVFPFQLKFRGGKGMSTIFGALLAYEPLLILILFGTCILFYPFIRRYTVTGLFAILVFPLELFFADFPLRLVIFSLGYAIVIIYACRSNVKEYIKTKAMEGRTYKRKKRNR